MSLTLGDATKSTTTLPPAGNHIARCYQIVDFGTHSWESKWGPKTARQIRILFELPNKKHVFKEENGPEPFAIGENFNFFLGEKAKFQTFLESWRGRPFTEKEKDTFELIRLLGVPCLVNITHIKSNKGNDMAIIKSIAPLPDEMKQSIPPAINSPLYYDVSMGINDAYGALPDWMQKKILECQEFQADGSEPKPIQNDDVPDDSVPF